MTNTLNLIPKLKVKSLNIVKIVLSILALFPLFFSLINSPVFGNVSLFAWFFYMIFSGLVAIIIFFILLFSSGVIVKFPIYIFSFLSFVGYVSFHGFAFDTVNFVHYYWLGNGAFLLALYFLIIKDIEYYTRNLYKGITVIVILESLVVVLQSIAILPVSNDSFLCTGTWINPNVTAIFLSLGLFAVTEVLRQISKRWISNILLLLIILAILLLYCRTAYIVSLLFIVNYYKGFFKSILKTGGRQFNIANIGIMILLIIIFLVFLSPFISKQESMTARVGIWKNSLSLILQEPISGKGFGNFEKEYNFFASSLGNPDNSHINMAYNDFLETTIEGGVFALIIWISFIFLFGKYCQIKKSSLLPLIGFVIIQITNFGFQAIPVTALFLIYIATGNKRIVSSNSPPDNSLKYITISTFHLKVLYAALLGLAIIFFIRIVSISGAYLEQKKLHENLKNPFTIISFRKIEPILKFSNGFYENFGDACMSRRQFKLALLQYKKALKNCSRPNVFAKCGYSYRMLKKYDSSRYYYQMVQKIEPTKLIPRMALLQLYQEQGDTGQILQTANEIISLPMESVTKRGIEIKEYAKKLVFRLDSINNTKTNK